MPCYTPAGRNINTDLWDVPDDSHYAACNKTAAVSMCCAIGVNRTWPDVCIDGGLCHNAYYGAKDQYWRESCTDPTWKDPACVKLFVNGTGLNSTVGVTLDSNGNALADVVMTNCDGGMWCYGENNFDCCRKGLGVFVLNGEQVDFDPSATSSSTSSSLSTSSSSTSSTDVTSTTSQASTTNSGSATAEANSATADSSSDNGGLSTGSKAGIGVGVTIAVLVVAALVFWFLWRRRRRTPATPGLATEEKHEEIPAEVSSNTKSHHHQPVQPSELEGEFGRRYELPAR